MREAMDLIIPVLLKRAGDANQRICSIAEELLYWLAAQEDLKGLQYIANFITKPIPDANKAYKHVVARLKVRFGRVTFASRSTAMLRRTTVYRSWYRGRDWHPFRCVATLHFVLIPASRQGWVLGRDGPATRRVPKALLEGPSMVLGLVGQAGNPLPAVLLQTKILYRMHFAHGGAGTGPSGGSPQDSGQDQGHHGKIFVFVFFCFFFVL